MKTLTIRTLLLSASVLLLMAVSAVAQGVIVPGPCERCPDRPRQPLPRSLPIKSIKIDTRITSQVAITHVEQVFRNDTESTLEGTYFFPIPEQASITEFAIWDGDRRLVGEVRSREEARRIYDSIVRRQRDPGLLEYAGKDLFQASIFPIPPHADKKLEITYSQVLRAESGTVAYRYPLGLGRQSAQIGSVSARIELESKDPLRNIYSPTHAIEVKRNGSGRALVTFENQGEPQDFQLFYALSKEDFGVTLLTHREPGKDGYFLLMISPKDNWSEQEYAAKDIVFVLDTSGSMTDEGKMEKARAALLYGIKILRPADRFNIISFAGEEHLLSSELINADENGRARAVRFVEALKAVGGTNIDAALTAARDQIRRTSNEGRPRMIVFLTDGLPTVGTTNVDQILANVKNTEARIFPFGVGYDVNTSLLDRLAGQSGGVADYIEPKEDLEVKVSNFFSRISYPVLSDLRLDMAGVETDLSYPRNLPDLFRGSQLTIIGRYRNPIDMDFVRLTLSGKGGGSERKFFYNNLHFPLQEEANDFLPRLWATRRVGWLMEQVRTNGEQREIRDEIVDLGTRYGIVTPYTSYLALEQGAMAQDVTRPASRIQGFSSVQPAAGAPPPPAPAPKLADAKAITGNVAVQQSKRARAQQEAERLDRDGQSAAIRVAGGKTFYLRDGVWTDADFKADAKLPEKVIKFGSDEYFALLKQKPKLAAFFSLGEQVVVILDGTVYRATAADH